MNGNVSIGWVGPQEGCWGWLLEHFADVQILRESDVDVWSRVKGANRVLLAAIDGRHDCRLTWLASYLERTSKEGGTEARIGAILSSDWAGHRRTKPLNDLWCSFYWYELYDRLIPWLWQSADSSTFDASRTSVTKRSNPRVERLFAHTAWCHATTEQSDDLRGAIALVISDSESQRAMWTEGFQRVGCQAIGIGTGELKIWTRPDWIIIDVCDPSAVGEIAIDVSRMYKHSVTVVADAFPSWEKWHEWQVIGVDVMVRKPFGLSSLLVLLNHQRQRFASNSRIG